LTDSKFVETFKKVDAKQMELPMYEKVMEKIGKPIVFNICMLGALVGITDLLKPTSIMDVLKTRIPEDFLEMNKEALELGMDMGAELKNR
ncbi:MAG: 2-oxoacid:acceptor oxidoreductase family protein, partial [Thermodesulfobacteriota bacterium]|nr:2-oxoacid:acceptor oxidoreductase family protein [Thermodesulfobacteriota bacterium]